MRFRFVTSHADDLRLFEDRRQAGFYIALVIALLAFPLVGGRFFTGELAYVFILAIAGIGLMIVAGYCGLVSLGHAAFLGIGAYAHAYLLKLGCPVPIALVAATALSGLIGLMIGLPILRLAGIYMAMATFGFSMIFDEIFGAWTSVTGGLTGLSVRAIELPFIDVSAASATYYTALFVLVLVLVGAASVVRGPTGRALTAIRDSEVAAQSMGIAVARYKSLAFAISAAVTGAAGALFAHRLGHLSPEAFTFVTSLQLILLVVVGGLGSLHGAVIGAVFIGLLPQLISVLREMLPPAIGRQPALEPGIFGLVLIVTVLFEPLGLYGRWLKIRAYLEGFPLYRAATFRRVKTYMRSERLG